MCSLAAQKCHERKKREKVNSAARLLTFFFPPDRRRENTYEFCNIKINRSQRCFHLITLGAIRTKDQIKTDRSSDLMSPASQPDLSSLPLSLPLRRHFSDQNMLISNERALSHASQYAQEANSTTDAHLHWNRIVAESNWNSSWRKWVKFSAAHWCWRCRRYIVVVDFIVSCFLLLYHFSVMQSRFVAKTRRRDICSASGSSFVEALDWSTSNRSFSLRKMIAEFFFWIKRNCNFWFFAPVFLFKCFYSFFQERYFCLKQLHCGSWTWSWRFLFV